MIESGDLPISAKISSARCRRNASNFPENRIHERRRRTLSRRFDKFHAFEDRRARRNSGEKLQLIRAETQRGENLAVQPLDFLR